MAVVMADIKILKATLKAAFSLAHSPFQWLYCNYIIGRRCSSHHALAGSPRVQALRAQARLGCEPWMKRQCCAPAQLPSPRLSSWFIYPARALERKMKTITILIISFISSLQAEGNFSSKALEPSQLELATGSLGRGPDAKHCRRRPSRAIFFSCMLIIIIETTFVDQSHHSRPNELSQREPLGIR